MTMKKLLLVLALLSLPFCAVKSNAQGIPNFGGNGVPNGGGSSVQVNLTATTAPTVNNDQTQGYAVGSLWQNANTGQVWIARSVSTSAAVWDIIKIGGFSGYRAGNWYVPFGVEGSTNGTGANPGAGSIRLFPIEIPERITIGALGARISTLAAGGNLQLALYANNNSTCQPTGTALASTSSISTASTGGVNGSVSIQINPGLYWLASNVDNATVILNSTNIASFNGAARLCGSSTQADVFAGQTLTGYSVTQAFGTWPDLTSASFSDITTNTVPVVIFQVSSVP